MNYENHPIACIFPMMDEKSYQELKRDIAANGVEQWGLLFEGKILDGRNRYKACCELGIEMTWQEVELNDPEEAANFDPLQHVLTHNLHRRHLKQSQRAMIAAKMANICHGKHKELSNDNSLQEVADLLSVSKPTVCRAKHVIEHGSKQLIEAVEACEITVSMAEKLCKACGDKREQTRLVKDGKTAIKQFLNPTPHETNEGDRADVNEIAEVGDKYEYQIVKMFRCADYRMNTVRMLVNELEPHEKSTLLEWLKEVEA